MKLIKPVILPMIVLFASSYTLANQTVTIDELNSMPAQSYEKALGAIFENATWPIADTAKRRPFSGFVDMYIDIVNVVKRSAPDKQLELIRAHPELACKNLREDNIAAHSQNEQSSAGLNECTADEAKELASLNKAYSEKFGFPFLLAVKNASKQKIFSSLKSRINHSKEVEVNIALQQEYKIILFRLLDKVQ